METAKKYWWIFAAVGLWAFFRSRDASERGVPLDLAFKHPFTSVGSLSVSLRGPQ